ncbi:hypothetical protein M3Y97_00201300 [Aphelenchoides bicaudatus]|nr:hypothetical protein M3Y97_00201300 [Aphelenchoides bicaudatus]
METLVNSPIATEFDPHTLPFTPSDPLLNSVGINHLAMIRIMYDRCPEFARAVQKSKVQNIKATEISESRGFLSHILLVCIQFVDPTQPDFSFVIKVPQSETYDEIVDSYNGSSGSSSSGSVESESPSTASSESSICSTHNNECDFYELFESAHFSLALPQIYYTRRNLANNKGGMIFMENLSNRGSCVDVFSSLTPQQCRNVTKEVALFQAHFDFMAKEQQDIVASDECVHTAAHKQQFLDDFLSKIGSFGQEFTDLLEKLHRFANTKFAKYALIDRPQKEGISTLVHGDTWTNNVLFVKGQDGELTDELCSVIDWQTAFQGNPLFDLSFLLVSSTNADVRREISEEVVDLYFEHSFTTLQTKQQRIKVD